MSYEAKAVEAAARAMAILNDVDGCFLELDAWEAMEGWEQDAYPDSHPDDESLEYWRELARVAVAAATPQLFALLANHLADGMGSWAGDAERGFVQGFAEAATEAAEAA